MKGNFREYRIVRKKKKFNLSDVVAVKSNSSLEQIEVQSQLLPNPSKILRPHSANESSPKKENSKFLAYIRKMKPKDFMAEYHKKTFFNAAANYALSLPCKN